MFKVSDVHIQLQTTEDELKLDLKPGRGDLIITAITCIFSTFFIWFFLKYFTWISFLLQLIALYYAYDTIESHHQLHITKNSSSSSATKEELKEKRVQVKYRFSKLGSIKKEMILNGNDIQSFVLNEKDLKMERKAVRLEIQMGNGYLMPVMNNWIVNEKLIRDLNETREKLQSFLDH